MTFPTPGVMFQGGLPLVHQGECVGAIGVSGVQSHEDEQIAQAGVTALGYPHERRTSASRPGLSRPSIFSEADAPGSPGQARR